MSIALWVITIAAVIIAIRVIDIADNVRRTLEKLEEVRILLYWIRRHQPNKFDPEEDRPITPAEQVLWRDQSLGN